MMGWPCYIRTITRSPAPLSLFHSLGAAAGLAGTIGRLTRGTDVSILVVSLASGCRLFRPPAAASAPHAPEPLPVKKVPEELVVAAWSEPAKLPPGGGQTQILVRVQKRGGAPYP